MDISANKNVIVETQPEPDIAVHQTKYMKYKYCKRLHHWRSRQDILLKNIERIKKNMEKIKKQYENYRLRLWEYEGYVINHIVEPPLTLLEATAMRLGERLETLQEGRDDDEESMEDDMSDMQSVSTCDTELADMREALRRRR